MITYTPTPKDIADAKAEKATLLKMRKSHIAHYMKHVMASRISRENALATGLTQFMTGEPCDHGHIAQRSVQTGECLKCVSNTPAGRVYASNYCLYPECWLECSMYGYDLTKVTELWNLYKIEDMADLYREALMEKCSKKAYAQFLEEPMYE